MLKSNGIEASRLPALMQYEECSELSNLKAQANKVVVDDQMACSRMV